MPSEISQLPKAKTGASRSREGPGAAESVETGRGVAADPGAGGQGRGVVASWLRSLSVGMCSVPPNRTLKHGRGGPRALYESFTMIKGESWWV